MLRFLEIILGLQRGFLSEQGKFSLQFNPAWPWQQYVGGAAVWNLVLGAAALALVIYVYRHEGRGPRLRIGLGIVRALLLATLLVLLNRPVLTLGQVRREPSVLAILLDDSQSMMVKDASSGGQPIARLDAVINLLNSSDSQLLRKLAAIHTIKFYQFSRNVHQIAGIEGPLDAKIPATQPGANPQLDQAISEAAAAISNLKPQGDATQLVPAIRGVMEDLQGQRVAGIVVFTDGRQTPDESRPEAVAAIKSFGMNVYPVPVGSDKMPRNVAVDAVNFEPSAFVDDITDFKITLHATGYEPNHPIKLSLKRQITSNGQTTTIPVLDAQGQEITKTVEAADDRPFEAELQYKPTKADMPSANLVVEAEKLPGELDDAANQRKVQLAVLDDNISMLLVDGLPRWDYRYLKTAMLRDHSIKISCLLTSADPAFRQEGSDDDSRPGKTWAITAFPTTMEQLLDYDVVVLGDVDPRQFTDAQLQMISDFVSKKGGGLEMVAGERYAPQAFRNTAIEPVLPVIIKQTQADDPKANFDSSFRPAITEAGMESSIFRFFPDPKDNRDYLTKHLQEMFWYCRGLVVKPGVGITFAENPTDLGPDNRKAPLLVAGRFGAGRTIFSAYDDSWRWRFYTGESIFNTYWVEQMRYLARGRKLGERKLTFNGEQAVYELGKQVSIEVRILSPDLMQKVSSPIVAEIVDDSTGQPVRKVELNRQEGETDVFSGSYTADGAGQFTAKLPPLTDSDVTLSYKVETPRLELANPTLDMASLSRLATVAPIPFAEAAAKLPTEIRSAARIIPVDTSQPLWNAPLAMIIFVLLISIEWILRKLFGML